MADAPAVQAPVNGTAQGDALLVTKLRVPRAAAPRVPRQRLRERLAEGLAGPLTLVCAPAGYGKTTLLADHVARDGRPVAWLSLDAADNDPARFWGYVLAALEAARPGVGAVAQALLRSPQPPPPTTILTTLINALAAAPEPVVLTLDDYHVIASRAIHDALAFLLDHAPPQLHVALTSRADPPLPLARLRARGQLAKIRATDLRFTPDEAAAFLNGAMDLALSPAEVAALAGRTEGWIAGLQLAALAVRGRADAPAFIAAFAGSHRYILDYLTEEVLGCLPERVAAFLLETSVLDRLCGELCDAITEGGAAEPDGQETLEALEQANLFITPLDEGRRWYRYHPLFADVLRHRLRRAQAERLPELYRRAAAWHERHDLVPEAIRYALAAGDVERAARLVEANAEARFARAESATLRDWLAALPDELVRARPRLAVAQATIALWGNDLGVVEGLLEDAERASQDQAAGAAGPWLGDLQGIIAAIRALLANLAGDPPRAIALSQQARLRLAADNLTWRGAVDVNLARAYWKRGEVAAAERALVESELGERRFAGDLILVGVKYAALGRLRMLRGRLHEAEHTYRRRLEVAIAPGGQVLPIAGWAYRGLGELLAEWDDLEGAARLLTRSIALNEQAAEPVNLAGSYVAVARVRQAQGDAAGALEAIERALPLAP
ncbi:MAG: helix-turn-helix transcriptional regulator, partial [Chloroflexota bacterium]|nr:helix-turn-helix transcriptional regulator [Chloroflexota bacterium]